MSNNFDSLLYGINASYLESLLDTYWQEPDALPKEWATFFKENLKLSDLSHEPSHPSIREHFYQLAQLPPSRLAPHTSEHDNNSLIVERKNRSVLELIANYRLLGHLHAKVDPLNLQIKHNVPELDLIYYGLSQQDFAQEFDAGNLEGDKIRPLKKIHQDLQAIYCRHVASEYMHLTNSSERWWVQSALEQTGLGAMSSTSNKKRIFETLVATEGLEKYLGAKYPGAKRFSLEGNDSLIVALDTLIQSSGSLNVKEVVLGMAHRGRLNVLVNILGKMPSQLFDEFEGKVDTHLESGDVKYHQGFSSDIETPGGNVHVSLAFNPSHLEIVSSVVLGSVRARLDKRKENNSHQVLPILLHGDAAFAGQGVVMETLNMSLTRGYGTGGSIHIIVNNQIGFTTSHPEDARSTLYCSDVAKMIQAPIFHVNCDDPEAVFAVTQLALQYRTKFNKDVVIDLVGYRRHGHNEADEPAVTQPKLYQVIRQHPTVLSIYAKQLQAESIISPDETQKAIDTYRETLDKRQGVVAKNHLNNWRAEFLADWTPYKQKDWRLDYQATMPILELKQLAERLLNLPDNFKLHPRVQKIIDDRHKMHKELLPLDWGFAENLAYASLLDAGYMVRLSGQDCQRGTFFHRHAVLHQQDDEHHTHIPLKHLSQKQGYFNVVDSLLSELAVLGFEYGFSATEPRALTIWEAQFGDFANGAQIVIDQFISSGEQKWGRFANLTLLLPHGYEGMGPEHSSARLERFLQLSAQNNIQVAVPSTPAQNYHLLRRQILRQMRKPLIVMSPKSLLRHKTAVSSLDDLATGSFQAIIQDDCKNNLLIQRLVLCSGKVYYELKEALHAANLPDVLLLRVEQLYPFPDQEISACLAQFKLKSIVWAQEEPKNQGAWTFVQAHLEPLLHELKLSYLSYAGRPVSASPAVGYHHLHEVQQSNLIKQALGL